MVSSTSHIWQCKLKMLQLKQAPNPKLSLFRTTQQYHRWQQKRLQHSLITHRNGTQQVLWHQWKIYRSSESANIPLNFNNNWHNAAIRITNTTESPYSIKKNTQIAEFSVVTPETSKFIRPVDTAILSMIPEGDPDLTTYLNELLRANKPEQ